MAALWTAIGWALTAALYANGVSSLVVGTAIARRLIINKRRGR